MPYTTKDAAQIESEMYYQTLVGSLSGKTGHNDDVDAFRHAYTSGVYRMERGEAIARTLGDANEARGEWLGQPPEEKNMDQWNNRVGRDLADGAVSKSQLAQRIADALANGDLIDDPSDTREYDDDDSDLDDADDLSEDEDYEDEDMAPDENEPYSIPDPLTSLPEEDVCMPLYPIGGVPVPRSPLVLDTDFSGTVELTTLGEVGTYFDFDNNGQAELTAWITGGDALLVKAGENGKVDNGSELFGSETIDGFTALRSLDSNGDKQITSADNDWDELSLWIDSNMDGVTQEGELHTLLSHNIISISLNAVVLPGTTEISGNQITHTSTFTTSDLEKHEIVDAWFDRNLGMTRNVADYSFDIRAAFLPTLRGFGDLKDLHIASSIDNGATDSVMSLLINIRSDVQSFTDAGEVFANWSSILSDVDALMLKWADVESVVLSARGSHVNAQHLSFYEALTGQPFLQYGKANPLPEAGAFIERAYEYIRTFFTVQIIAQIIGKDIFETAPTYNLIEGKSVGEFLLSQDGIDGIVSAAISSSNAADTWTSFAQFIGYTKGLDNLTVGEISALDSAVALTNDPALNDWQDVVSTMLASLGNIIEEAEDFGSFEIYYDNLTVGTSGADSITENNANGFHNNEFRGLDGNDIINAGDGHDKLIGGNGNDTLIGGSGDDYLLGGMGDDLYHWDSGNDTISEIDGGGYDEIHILSSTGLTTSNITDLYRYGDELILLLSTGSSITIDGYSDSSARVEKIVFDSNSSFIDLTTIIEQKFYGTSQADNLTVTGDSFQTLLVYGYGSNDIITADGGAAKFYGGDGYDTLIGDYLPDYLYGDNQDDYLDGAGGNDTLQGGAGNDYLFGGDGNDTIEDSSGNDVINGGAGNDWLAGDNGNDIYQFGIGYGQDTIYDLSTVSGSRDDQVHFMTGILPSDVIVSRTDNSGLILSIIGTTDTLTLRKQEFAGLTYSQIESVHFENSTVWDAEDLRLMSIDTATTSGNDIVYGFEGYNDILDGGAGNDTLYGYDGDDTYVFGIGYGNDIISDNGGYDTVTMLSGILPGDVTVTRGTNSSFVLSIAGTSDTLTLLNQERYSPNYYRVNEVVFANATVWNETQLRQMSLDSQVTSGNDTVTGYLTADTITGGAGNDTVRGGDGGDTYLYNLGDGQDIFEDTSGTDNIKFGAGILSSHLTMTRVGDDLNIAISAAPSSSIVVKNHYASSSKVIEKIIFNDNSELSILPSITGTSGNDTMNGTSAADLMYGLAGNDTINAGSGNDEIYGDDGTDTINGQAGNDIIFGGTGIDTIDGGDNNDTIYGEDGNDILKGGNHNDIIYGGAGDDSIEGGSGTDTVSYENVTNAVSVNLLTGTGSGEGTDTYLTIENIIATAYDDTLTGSNGVNNIVAGDGNDIIKGNQGDDVMLGGLGDDQYLYLYGDDEDYVTDDGGYDILEFLGTSTAELLDFYTENHDSGAVADDVKIDFNNTSTQEVVVYDQVSTTMTNRKIELIKFFDGFTLDFTRYGTAQWVQVGNSTSTQNESAATEARTILGGTNANTITGTAYADEIHSDTGNDTIHGGAGNDRLHGGTGTDTVNGDAGDDLIWGGAGNDTLNGGADIDTVIYQSSTAAVTVNLATGTATGEGTDTLTNFENIIGSVNNDTLTGNSGNNVISGGTGNDTISGADGADTLYGGDGNDSLTGGNGNDTLYGGYGTDSFTGSAGADTFMFEEYSAYQAVDTIADFSTVDGDMINIADLLGEYDPLNDAITDFVQMATSGSNTTLSIDKDGAGGIYSFVQIATLTGVTGLTDEAALATNGNLIVT